ncbi:helix-turn-helix transcriptional regulator [Alteromonas pelagimontana]
MLLSISSTTLWRHVKSGELPPPKYVGKSRYWRYEDILRFV